ncbi:MAG: nuclear transport factor 2 family protein [Betaproteobacteria bacterium]|nr:MAG: nuclear transport factor 2 family protein [Betaproteobacteria bacterium]
MQYQSNLNEQQLIDLAVNQYFGNVDKKDLEAVLNCFHDNAMLTVQTAFTQHEGKQNIGRMFKDFFDSYDVIVHRDFTYTVDETNGRIVASFIAELKDSEGNMSYLHNTNFWRIRDNKFQEVYVYMSGENPLV